MLLRSSVRVAALVGLAFLLFFIADLSSEPASNDAAPAWDLGKYGLAPPIGTPKAQLKVTAARASDSAEKKNAPALKSVQLTDAATGSLFVVQLPLTVLTTDAGFVVTVTARNASFQGHGYYARLIGPAIVLGRRSDKGATASLTATFHFEAPPLEGDYRLSIEPSFVRELLDPPTNVAMGTCACAPLLLVGSRKHHVVHVTGPSRLPTAQAPFCGRDILTKTQFAGWWTLKPHVSPRAFTVPAGIDLRDVEYDEAVSALFRDYRWTPWACRFANKPFYCPAIRDADVWGDSHSRKLTEELARKGLRPNYVSFRAIYESTRPDGYHEDPSIPVRRSDENRVLDYADQRFNHSRPAVLFNTGHWDLRDVTVDTFVKDMQRLADGLAKSSFADYRGLRVWRSIPAYSYRRDLMGLREYRTNEKILEANERARTILAAVGFVLFDTYALTAPVFDMSCDTHHYLCHDDTTSYGYGLKEIRLLDHFLCHP